jgi:hypothetical protein
MGECKNMIHIITKIALKNETFYTKMLIINAIYFLMA